MTSGYSGRRPLAAGEASAPRATASRAAKSEKRDPAALLVQGPFSDALRAAIRMRGLGLERIQAKLAAEGTPISLATLSHWQSGRSQPERETSLLALSHLERVLGLPPQALAALLEPPRRRGRRTEHDAVDLVQAYHKRLAVAAALREFAIVWGNSMVGLSEHDRVEVGSDGLVHSIWHRRVVRATTDGPDRMISIQYTDGASAPTITPLYGCSLGQVVTNHDAGVTVAELMFGHPLRDGESVITEHRVDFAAPYAADTEWVRFVPKPLREFVVEVGFAGSRKPVRCLQITSPDMDCEDFTERLLNLDEYGRASAVALDVGPCQFGIRWEWPRAEDRGF